MPPPALRRTTSSSMNPSLMPLLAGLKKNGGYLVTGEDRAKLKAAMWPDGSHLSGKIVAKSVKVIAAEAGIIGP